MRRRAVALGTALLLAAGAAATAVVSGGHEAPVRQEVLRVQGVPEGGTPVELDATLFLPKGTEPAPAVLLAHGFGGSKADLVGQAEDLAREGYVVLTYSARGFGTSGGLIHLDQPAFEVADAQRLLDLLASRPEVMTDAPGDARVGVAGASYGGALSLLLAGNDRRVDAVVASITWNDLQQSLFPQSAVRPEPRRSPAEVAPIAGPGVYKRGWAGLLFSIGAGRGGAPGCGRFAPDVCAAYAASAQAGRPTAGIEPLMRAASPASVLADINAPTLLLQGQTDALFPLSEADANARGIAAAGTPVKTVWFDGGHDGGNQERDRLGALTLDHLDRYLDRDGSEPDLGLEITAPAPPAISEREQAGDAEVRVATGPVRELRLPLTGGSQTALSPPGGSPAALTSLPGAADAVGAALGALGGALSAVPGQTAAFQTEPLSQRTRVAGTPTVQVSVASTTGDGTLFAALSDVGADGRATLPKQLVAPVRLTGLPPQGAVVQVALPAVVLDVPAGHRLRVTLASTDQAYAVPSDARAYRIAPAGELVLPQVPTRVVGDDNGTGLLVAGGAALGLLLVGLAVLGRRRSGAAGDPATSDVPLVIQGLGKTYSGGYRAVSDLSFRVEAGQVVGLLGPNGAGKTTTLRMLMGLILPTEGSLTVFGHRVTPGAPVLSRLGSFVEGPGFLPHLSGLDNLHLFWRATGRPAERAHLETALEVAGLGDDVHRKVRTYSQGMRQRLAIAQAMLGLPDLLVLDEPTNGLDPPQIREMRDVLNAYAATGRTVLVSSHLLGEVEQTCSHVVVMHHGRLVAQGPVAELVGSASALVVTTDDPPRAAHVAGALPGAQDVTMTATGITLRLLGTPRSDLTRALVQAGVAVDGIAPQRGLEEAFLALIGEEA